VRVIDWLIEHADVEGAVNVTAPTPLPNRELMRTLREAWGAPMGLPATQWMVAVGAWVLRTDPELVLKSRRVVPERLLVAGFRFDFPEWPEAAKELVRRWRETR
jgi:NAD dependent epimerase/dehydratase family enzyme